MLQKYVCDCLQEGSSITHLLRSTHLYQKLSAWSRILLIIFWFITLLIRGNVLQGFILKYLWTAAPLCTGIIYLTFITIWVIGNLNLVAFLLLGESILEDCSWIKLHDRTWWGMIETGTHFKALKQKLTRRLFEF